MASCKIGCHGASPTVPVPNRICKVGLVPALNPAEGSSENSNYRHRHILHDLVMASFQVFCILACLHGTTASQQRLLWSCLEGQNPQHFSHPVCFSWIFFFFLTWTLHILRAPVGKKGFLNNKRSSIWSVETFISGMNEASSLVQALFPNLNGPHG